MASVVGRWSTVGLCVSASFFRLSVWAFVPSPIEKDAG